MKRLLLTALLSGAALSHAQTASAPAPSSAAKKELVQKVLLLQQPGIDNMARNLVEQPAARMMQEAARALQQQVAPEKREAVGKSIEADVKKYVEETLPIVRERATKVAPSTIGAVMEERFTEDELKQLLAWFESPVNKKYMQVGGEMQTSFMQKLVAESRPLVEPRLQALEAKVRASLGIPAAPAAAASGSAKAAPSPAKKASGSK
jgi:hypothetical protein